jgi:hypothetical protein
LTDLDDIKTFSDYILGVEYEISRNFVTFSALIHNFKLKFDRVMNCFRNLLVPLAVAARCGLYWPDQMPGQ